MKNYNLLLTNISKVNNNSFKTEYKYVDENENELKGYLTNEAPIKSVIKRLKENNDNLNEIVFICSDSVMKAVPKKEGVTTGYIDGKKNSYDILCELISGNPQAEEVGAIQKTIIKLADEPDEANLSEAINRVRERIIEIVAADTNRKVNIYIESNGGVRYVLTMLLSIIKSLELTHGGRIEIIEILSMVKKDEGEPTLIKNTKSIYDTAQISGLVDEFLNYGRIEGLKKYFEKDDTGKVIKDMIGTLSEVSDDIQLCRTERMLLDFYGSDSISTKIKKFLDIHDNVNKIFSMILKEIKSEIDKTKGSTCSEDEPIIYLPQMIQWCLDKSFIQQALTLCAEKTAEFLFKTEIIIPQNAFEERLQDTDTKEYTKEYYFLAHITEYTGEITKAKVNDFLKAYKEEIKTDLKIDIEEKRNGSYVIKKYDTAVSCSIDKDSYNDIYIEIKNVFKNYIDNDEKGSFSAYQNKKIEISKKYGKATVKDILFESDKLPDYLQGNDEKARRNRSEKLLRFFITQVFKNLENDRIASCTEQYKEMIKKMFDERSFTDILINKYAEKQSEKYYIKEAIELNLVSTNKSSDIVQKILYLYSLCKEQRNFSNHATVKNDDISVAMNSEQIKTLIKEFLRSLNMD